MSSTNISPDPFVDHVHAILALYKHAITSWLPSGCESAFSKKEIVDAIIFANVPESWKNTVSTAFYRPGHFNVLLNAQEKKSIGDGLCAFWACVVDHMVLENVFQRYRMCAIMRAISIAQQVQYPSTWTEESDNFAMSDLLSIFNRKLIVRFQGDTHTLVLTSNDNWAKFGESLFYYALQQSIQCDNEQDLQEMIALEEEIQESNGSSGSDSDSDQGWFLVDKCTDYVEIPREKKFWHRLIRV